MTEQLVEIRTADLALPPIHAEIDSVSQTPVPSDGSFLNTSGKCPIDQESGLPLPIAPKSNIDNVRPENTNYHHHFYPRLSPVLRDTRGGRALRVSRIQRVGIEQHNFGDHPYHTFFPEGPDLPTETNAQLGLVTLACAGYLSDKVVDTSNGEPIVRDIKDWERAQLTRPHTYMDPRPQQVKRFRDRRLPGMRLIDAKAELVISRQKQASLTYKNLIYGYDPIKSFITEQVLSQDFESVDRKLSIRFLEKGDMEAGFCLLAVAAQIAAKTAVVQGQSLADKYVEFRREGRLHPAMPPNASTLLKNKLGHLAYREDALRQLYRHLAVGRESVA